MNPPPLSSLTPRALAAYLALPSEGLHTPRAAIEETLEVGPSSVTRYLQELARWGLILHTAHGAYGVPRQGVRRLLLAEPGPYHREVLLLNDLLLGEGERAFACLPVRAAIRMELPHAILVLPPDADLGTLPPQVARMRLQEPPRTCSVPVPSDASPPVAVASVPCTSPLDALALLASTGDADLVQAALDAGPRLDVRRDALAAATRRLKVVPLDDEMPESPNLVRHPAWLKDRVRAAGVTALRRTTRAAIEGGGAV
ncbi:MAG: hypothetical protein ACT4PT_11470 [Methanobacteriota archaeon]